MAYKTVSICKEVSFIVNVLHSNFGYLVTNLKTILVNEFEYKSTKDILKNFKISKTALYTPLVYRDPLSYSILVSLVDDLMDRYNSNEIKEIYCYNFYDYCDHYNSSLSDFRAEHVYEEQIKLLLNQYKFINYEGFGYLP